jgi:hypothetical protein
VRGAARVQCRLAAEHRSQDVAEQLRSRLALSAGGDRRRSWPVG